MSITRDVATASFTLRNSPTGGFGHNRRRNLKVRPDCGSVQFSASESQYVFLASCGCDLGIPQLPEEEKREQDARKEIFRLFFAIIIIIFLLLLLIIIISSHVPTA